MLCHAILTLSRYNDEEPAATKAAVPEVASQPPAPAPEPASYENYDTSAAVEPNGGQDAQMNEEYEEDEDDVDFNLGNDSTHRERVKEDSPVGMPPQQQMPVARGPNSKEDG